MDALRIILLSLMVGQSVSTNANFTEKDFVPTPVSIVATNPAPVTSMPLETAAPTAPVDTVKKSGLSRNLRLGMKGEDVKRVQQLLSELGYDVAPGGTFSAQTEEAVMFFQYVNNLSVDGIVGAKTYRKLTSQSALGPSGTTIRTQLSYGMTGQDVMELQIRLGQLGYYDDIVTGNYLKNTRKAVALFQEAHGLFVDGIAGPNTLYLIFSQMAVQKPNPTKPGVSQTNNPKPSATSSPTYTRTLSMGMSGTDVLQLTTRLKQLGFFPYDPSNFFDESIYWSVYTFQQFNKIKPDGIAGDVTLTRVYASDAVPFSTDPQGTTAPPSTPPTTAPTSAPTAVPTSEPTTTPIPICARCGQYILQGQENNHAPNPAACGTDNHYHCDGLVHEAQPCGAHLKCLPDGRDHRICSVEGCGKPLCDGHTHP